MLDVADCALAFLLQLSPPGLQPVVEFKQFVFGDLDSTFKPAFRRTTFLK